MSRHFKPASFRVGWSCAEQASRGHVFSVRGRNRKETTMSMSMQTGRSDAAPRTGRHDLIGSDRVEGTNVYRSDGKKIGEIERVMIEKKSGCVSYAVPRLRRVSRHRQRPLSASLG